MLDFVVNKINKIGLSYKTILYIKTKGFYDSYVKWESFGPFKKTHIINISQLNVVHQYSEKGITLLTIDKYNYIYNSVYNFKFLTPNDKKYFVSLIKDIRSRSY